MAKRRLKKNVKEKLRRFIIVVSIILIVVVVAQASEYYITYKEELKPIVEKKEYYNISDFGFAFPVSNKDYNNNGKDDYTDIFEGEKKYAEFNPKYKSEYYAGGYPPVEKEGIATDLIWYSLQNAGYNLKDLITKDIKHNRKKYDIEITDSNIDFRRIYVQETFFTRYAKELDTDMYNVKDFMPGDIITFDNYDHIAMVSDKYTIDGVPYIIHNIDTKQKSKEENFLEKTDMKITGHYRFEYNKKLQELINS